MAETLLALGEAPLFRAADYLLPGSPDSPATAVGSAPAVTDAKQQAMHVRGLPGKPMLDLRVLCGPARAEGEQQGSAAEESASLSLVHSARTSSVTAEARSPSRRHPSGNPSGSSSRSVSDDQEVPDTSVPLCAGPQGRYRSIAPSSPSTCGPAAVSPAELPGSDSFATPPAGLVRCSSSSGNENGSWSGGSRMVTPVSQQQPSPQQQVEVLEAKLATEVEARRELQRRLLEQRSEAERQRQALGEQYEEQLSALRRELQQGVAERIAKPLGILTGSSSQQLTLSVGEQEVLRRQLADQELLLKAYQAENELAVARIKQQAAEQQRQAAEAARQVEELQQALALAQAERARQLPATPAVDAARLQELLRLQGELESVRAAANQRERELQQQVDQLGRQLHDAQQRLEGVTAQGSLLTQTQQQLAESDALVQQQARVIGQLEQQMLAQDARSAASGGCHSSMQQQQQLEAENACLRQSLQQAQAQIAALSCGQSSWGGGSSSTGGQQLEELHAKLAQLQDALALKEEQHQRQLRLLRHEHERLRVEQGIRAASKAGAARVRELEAQLALEREASARRLRHLESRLKEADAGSRRIQAAVRPPTGNGPAGCTSLAPRDVQAEGRPAGRAAAAAQHEALLAAKSQLQQKEQRLRRLESELARKDAELASLHQRASNADEQANAAAEREAATQREVAVLRQAVVEVSAANDGLQEQVRQVTALQQRLADQEREVAALRAQGERLQEAEAKLASLQQAQAEREAAATEERQRLQQSQAALARQSQQEGRAAAAAEWQSRVDAAEAAAAEWQARVRKLETDLRSARAGLPWVPRAADFAALELRLEEVEAAAQRREAKWRSVAEHSAQAAAAQHDELRRRFEGALAAKQQQVDEFQRQLNGLLAAARLLHVVGSEGSRTS